MIAKSAKIKRYEQRITQFRQNRMFYIDQKKIYADLNNGGKSQVMYLILRKVEDFGVTSRALTSNIIERHSG